MISSVFLQRFYGTGPHVDEPFPGRALHIKILGIALCEQGTRQETTAKLHNYTRPARGSFPVRGPAPGFALNGRSTPSSRNPMKKSNCGCSTGNSDYHANPCCWACVLANRHGFPRLRTALCHGLRHGPHSSTDSLSAPWSCKTCCSWSHRSCGGQSKA